MKEVGCGDCIGACCTANMLLPLDVTEAGVQRDAGTLMQVVVSPERPERLPLPETPHEQFVNDYASRLPEGVGLFKLLSNCAFLEPVEDGMAKCALFDDQNRPSACTDLTPGSKACRSARLTRGVWDY